MGARLDIGECMNYGTDNVSIGLPRNSSWESTINSGRPIDETKNNAGLDFFLNWWDAIVEFGI